MLSPTCVAVQLYLVLMEIEEMDRMKSGYRSEEDDRRNLEKKQKKVEYMYAQLEEFCPP